MALVFNQTRDNRQFVNPYGIKFIDSYFDIAKLNMEKGNLVANRPDNPDSYSLGKFIVSSTTRLSDRVRVCAVLWMDPISFIDLSYLSDLNPNDQSRVQEITTLLDKQDKVFTHSDIHDIMRTLNPELLLLDSYWFGGGIISIDRNNKILQTGLGSTFGVLPRSLVIDAFSDLAQKLGCTLQPICTEKEIGAANSNSDSGRWLEHFHIPRSSG